MARRMSRRFDLERGLRSLLAAIGFAALLITAQMILSGDARAEAGSEAAPSDYDWMLAVLNDNRIGSRVGHGATGNVAVNTAAGSSNVQANLRVINGHVQAIQRVDNPTPTGATATRDRTRIDGRAFAGGQGVLGVNQVAGNNNAQINTVALGATNPIRTLEPVMPARESDTAAREDGQSSESESSLNRYRAVVADTAFTGFGGVLQINQVSGARNVTGNHFSISGPRP
ncbi:hypothetical protein LV476_02745 [Guyparkeria hydrothermalis]|uniref:hypothetical protein n=1 Tax=Guyparkeria hydrothermalis TaxID=923 RepID=UPI0020219174|nr:hypothetical protein [Guyparkeria hydrothermalis]MCL7743872.1 hypothetical protein [Guyparkeria hydrothermalis]